MKKLILIGGLLLTTTSFASQLHTYNELVSAISAGKPLHFVTDFTQCSMSHVNAAKAASFSIAYFTPDQIGVSDQHIAMGMSHFTMFDPFFPNKPVHEYARYTITPDGNMEVILNVLDPATFATLMNPMTFICKIDGSTKVFA